MLTEFPTPFQFLKLSSCDGTFLRARTNYNSAMKSSEINKKEFNNSRTEYKNPKRGNYIEGFIKKNVMKIYRAPGFFKAWNLVKRPVSKDNRC